jgi:hypothetical protein
MVISMARRSFKTRLLRGGERDDGAFDDEFWQDIGPEGILEASWQMVIEARVWQGLDGDEPRLQRSVCRIQRRRG